jgi:hypothetical protein
MWVTRGCARCILFSFGYVKFLFLGSVWLLKGFFCARAIY